MIEWDGGERATPWDWVTSMGLSDPMGLGDPMGWGDPDGMG